MPVSTYLPRLLTPRLRDALEDTPVVLIHGPRQCGKSTLAKHIGEERGHLYVSFDDRSQREAARADPKGFLASLPPRAVLDEIQRMPDLLTEIKSVVDEDRRPGQFLLTGSANILLIPKLSESLAGRMEILPLRPFAQMERRRQEHNFLKELLVGNLPGRGAHRLGLTMGGLLEEGGYPSAWQRSSSSRRQAWYRQYLDALVQRDVRDVAQIRSLEVLPRLLTFFASQTARLVNVERLAAPFSLSRQTIQEYLGVLERIFLVERLPAWHANEIKRLVKRPKAHFTDAGLACALLDLDAADLVQNRQLLGQVLETFVVQEMRRLASGLERPLRFSHFRDRDGYEVDLVLEQGRRELFGIEVKAASSVREEDFRGLRRLQRICGSRFSQGILFYDGERSLPFGDKLQAIPLSHLWEGSSCASS